MIASSDLLALIDKPLRETQPVGYKPSFMDLYRVYNTYTSRQDLREGIANECAIRMSVALSLSGFSFETFANQNRVRSGGRTGLPVPHVLGAQELAHYLRTVWGYPDRPGLGSSAASSIEGRLGVIYFNNCFQRSGEASRAGDHIDLWTGQEYYNQILSLAAGVEDRSSTGNLFNKADRVWFWRLD